MNYPFAWQTSQPARIRRACGCVLFAALLVAAMSGLRKHAKEPGRAPKSPPSEIKVYESTELLHSQYSLVQHVWVDSWRSNIGLSRASAPKPKGSTR